MVIDTIERIKLLPKQREDSLTDAFGLLIGVEDRKSVDEYVKWIRSEARKIPSAAMYDLIGKTYLYSGQYSFDDFMIAMEWNREPNARFWLPRRKVWEGKHGVATQIQEFIDDDNALYLGLSCPPGTGKSTMIKFLLSYIIGKEPLMQNMYVSYSDGMIKLMMDSVKAMLTDTAEYRFNEIFPGVGTPDISAEYKTISYRRKGDFPSLGLVSLGGSVTGRTRANRFLVTDDLVANKEMARSPERLAKLNEDYKATLTTRMIGDRVKQVQLGTRWSVHDPIGRMQAEHESDPRYKFIAIPVEDEHGNSNFEFDHPDRYTKEKIVEIKKSLDPVDYSCLFMQRGIEKEGLAFPSDGLKYYNNVLPECEPDMKAFVVDVAWGGSDSLSMPICYVYGEDGYIVDWLFDKRDKSVTMPRMIGKILHHKPHKGQFESNNGGREYADEIDRQLRTDHDYRCNITSQKAPNNVSKMARIEQYAPDIKNLYFLAEQFWDDDYRRAMNELTSLSYTTKNLHDDSPDSLAQLVAYLNGGVKSVKAMRRPF